MISTLYIYIKHSYNIDVILQKEKGKGGKLMTPKERKIIFTIVGIMLLILIIVICVKSFGNGGNDNTNTLNTPTTNTATQNEEQYVTELNGGTKLNNSEDLQSVKTYKTLEISNVQFTSNSNGNSVFLADVKNVGTTATQPEVVKLTLLGENGEVITELNAVLPDLEPGETDQLNAQATADIVNAKDYTIEAQQ